MRLTSRPGTVIDELEWTSDERLLYTIAQRSAAS